MNETIFDDLLSFVGRAQARFDTNGQGSEQQSKPAVSAMCEIPTAALITGKKDI